MESRKTRRNPVLTYILYRRILLFSNAHNKGYQENGSLFIQLIFSFLYFSKAIIKAKRSFIKISNIMVNIDVQHFHAFSQLFTKKLNYKYSPC